jgi:hypothetical protein
VQFWLFEYRTWQIMPRMPMSAACSGCQVKQHEYITKVWHEKQPGSGQGTTTNVG